MTVKKRFTHSSLSVFVTHFMSIPSYQLLVMVALFLALTANYTFFAQVSQHYVWQHNALFLLSLFFVLMGLLIFLFTLIGNRYTLKPILIFFLLFSSLTSYFTDTYGTVYDVTMLQNALQTDQKESQDLLNGIFLLRVIILGILPSFYVYKVKLTYPDGIKKMVVHQTILMITALLLIILPIVVNSKTYASFFRVHKPLRYYTNPITPIYSVIKLTKIEYQKATKPKSLIYHAKDAIKQSTQKPRLMILVVGETARADHVNLNGYQRITFPKITALKEQGDNLVSFSQVLSCGTSTAYSVPCMFSYLGADAYEVDDAVYQENVLDTLHRVGITILWRDNNSSDKGVMERLKSFYQDYKSNAHNTHCNNVYQECRDSGMLVGLDEYIKNNENKDILIILHQMGNHGPAYYKRYDEQFNQFSPICQDNELSKCEIQSLHNAYDNALLATDKFLFDGIELLKQYQDNYDTALLYLSDHGESLGEKGIYLHGMPNAFAPVEQKHIPAFLWLGQDAPFVANKADLALSHDNISPTLLKFFGVQSEVVGKKTTFFSN